MLKELEYDCGPGEAHQRILEDMWTVMQSHKSFTLDGQFGELFFRIEGTSPKTSEQEYKISVYAMNLEGEEFAAIDVCFAHADAFIWHILGYADLHSTTTEHEEETTNDHNEAIHNERQRQESPVSDMNAEGPDREQAEVGLSRSTPYSILRDLVNKASTTNGERCGEVQGTQSRTCENCGRAC